MEVIALEKYKLEHHKELCIGCAACVAINPKDWAMDGDKAELLESKKEKGENGLLETKEISPNNALFEKNKEAAEACPVPCIFLKKTGGTQKK